MNDVLIDNCVRCVMFRLCTSNLGETTQPKNVIELNMLIAVMGESLQSIRSSKKSQLVRHKQKLLTILIVCYQMKEWCYWGILLRPLLT